MDGLGGFIIEIWYNFTEIRMDVISDFTET